MNAAHVEVFEGNFSATEGESPSADGGAIGRIGFKGAATVRTIETIHSALADAMKRYSAVEVDCAHLDAVDASFIQLVVAARKTAQSRGTALMLAQAASGALHEALVRGGFLVFVTGERNEKAEFWLKGATAQ